MKEGSCHLPHRWFPLLLGPALSLPSCDLGTPFLLQPHDILDSGILPIKSPLSLPLFMLKFLCVQFTEPHFTEKTEA